MFGIFQAYLRYISGISKAYFRHLLAISQAYLRHITGIFQVYLRHISGISQVYLRHITSISQAYLSHISQVSLWFIKGIYQVHLSPHSQHNIIKFILIWLFVTFIDTEIFAAYAGSCLLRKLADWKSQQGKKLRNLLSLDLIIKHLGKS